MGLSWKKVNSSAGRSRRRADGSGPTDQLQLPGEFQVGESVFHEVFGRGEVLSSQPGLGGFSEVAFQTGPRKIVNRYLCATTSQG